MKGLPVKYKVFFISVYIITLVTFIYSVLIGNISFNISSYRNVIFFVVLTALTETFTVHYNEMSFSTTFAITIATYILFGAFETTVVFIIGFLARVLKLEDGSYNHLFNSPLYGTLFNCCILVLPIFIADYFYVFFQGHYGVDNISTNVPQIIIFSFVYFLLNTFIISILMSFHTQKTILYCYFENIKLCGVNYITMIPFGVILVIVFSHYKYIGVALTFFPIVLARYVFSMYINTKTQYIQTVEALMNAIEARDEYTQGHSRRVAEISMEIAKS